MGSLWEAGTTTSEYNKLQGNIKTDALIIGGGAAGILCAFFLARKGVDYVLVEAGKIASGNTKNTTAKITSQHSLIYDSLIKNSGIEKARQYLMANQTAIEKYKEISINFPCDFEEKPAYVYSVNDREKLEKETAAVNKLGVKAEYVSNVSIPVDNVGAVKFNKQAQFNPLMFFTGIANGMNIYENTFVEKIDGKVAITDKGKITAKNIIIATHFPFINSRGCYFLKMYQHRSYVIALENAVKVDGMYVDEYENGMSFRNYKDFLMIGGGDHRTGKKGGGWAELRNFANQVYPKSVEKYSWAAQDCITLDNVPYIGRYTKNTHNLYVTTGFNKWGMTSSMVSAMILSDMITGTKNEFADVFNPDRSIMKKQLLLNGLEAAKNLLNFSTKRCTHLGCSLKWNKLQQSWDCPCHGSRFDKQGNVIDNPAMKSITGCNKK